MFVGDENWLWFQSEGLMSFGNTSDRIATRLADAIERRAPQIYYKPISTRSDMGSGRLAVCASAFSPPGLMRLVSCEVSRCNVDAGAVRG